MAVGDDGIIYAAPYADDNVLELDPITDIATITENVTSHGTGSQKWVGMIKASNGKLYANPHGAAGGYLIIDPTTDPINLDSVGAAYQVRGGAEVAGKIYSPRYSGTTPLDSLVVLDTASNTISTISYTVDRTGPIYSARPNWMLENIFGLYERYWGAVSGGNGKVYGIPYTSDRILIIDTVAGTAAQGADTLSGNDPIPAEPDPIDADNGPFWAKYNEGVLSSINGKIYSMPRHAKSILKIDPVDDSAVEIPLPPPLDGFPLLSKSFSTVEGPDGRIYSTPWQLPYLFWIDPVDDSIGQIDVSAAMLAEPAVNNYWTYAETVGAAIYFAPGTARNILKVIPANFPLA